MLKERTEPTPAGLAGEHRILVVAVAVGFVWLLVECAILLPGLIARYGWH